MNHARLVQVFYLAVGGVLLYFLYRTTRAAREALETVERGYERLRVGTADVIETFFPLVNPKSMITYAVTFPDGKRHAVPGEIIDRNGYFWRNGVRFRVYENAKGEKIAMLT